MKKTNIEAFETTDGKLFIAEEEALAHQKEIDSTRYFRVGYPDCKNDRLIDVFEFFAVVGDGYIEPQFILEEHLIESRGPRVTYVEGDGKEHREVNWEFNQITQEEIPKTCQITFIR